MCGVPEWRSMSPHSLCQVYLHPHSVRPLSSLQTFLPFVSGVPSLSLRLGPSLLRVVSVSASGRPHRDLGGSFNTVVS